MADQTKIEWTDATANFWEGCQKVGPGCDNCYAEATNKRFAGGRNWGPGAPRKDVEAGFKTLRRMQRGADKFRAEHGHWPRIFCSSNSDIFDNAADPQRRAKAFKAMEQATKCRIQMLTKRVGNVFQMIPPGWASRNLSGWPSHIGLMITVVNQTEADRDIPKLLDLKAKLGIPWVGLSMEPLLGPVDLTKVGMSRWPASTYTANTLAGYWDDGQDVGTMPKLDWVIVGGESGRAARPMHPDWPAALRNQCSEADVPFFFKQWGEWAPDGGPCEDDTDPILNGTAPCAVWRNGGWQHHANGYNVPTEDLDKQWVYRVGKRRAGRALGPRTHNEMPRALT